MLDEYENFKSQLKQCGEAACGVAVVATPSLLSASSSTSSSASPWSSSSRLHLVVSSATSVEANGLGSAVGGSQNSPSLEASLTAGCSSSSGSTNIRDHLVFVLCNSFSSSCSTMCVGTLNYESIIKKNENNDIPITVLVPLLFALVRSTGINYALSASGSSPPPVSDAMSGDYPLRVAAMEGTSQVALLLDIRGAVRRQIVVPLRSVESAERRNAALSFMMFSLMRSQQTLVASVERERKARTEAEETVSRLQEALASGRGGTTGVDGAGDSRGAHPSSVGAASNRMHRPQSLLNPQQKAPMKRPRGVKLS